jgi:hypothetical protein
VIHDDATCYKCGANAWTSCKHREATRQAPVVEPAFNRKDWAFKNGGTGGGRYSIKRINGAYRRKTS